MKRSAKASEKKSATRRSGRLPLWSVLERERRTVIRDLKAEKILKAQREERIRPGG